MDHDLPPCVEKSSPRCSGALNLMRLDVAEQEKTNVNEGVNGESGAEEAQAQFDAQAKDIAATYEKARKEMIDAVGRLRAEVARLNVQQAQDWVRDNPALATLLTLGAGLVIGRLVGAALRPPPPPPLSRRIQTRALELASQAQQYAREAGDVVGRKAGVAGEDLAHRAEAFGRLVARRAAELGELVGEQAADYGTHAAEQARIAAASLQDSAQDLTSTLEKKTSRGVSAAEAAFNVAKTTVAAVLVKKVSDWMRQVT